MFNTQTPVQEKVLDLKRHSEQVYRGIRKLCALLTETLSSTTSQPSFESVFRYEVCDTFLESLPAEDRKPLIALLKLIAKVPNRWVLRLIKKADAASLSQSNSKTKAILRQLDFGLKGLVWTVYYYDEGAKTPNSIPRK